MLCACALSLSIAIKRAECSTLFCSINLVCDVDAGVLLLLADEWGSEVGEWDVLREVSLLLLCFSFSLRNCVKLIRFD